MSRRLIFASEARCKDVAQAIVIETGRPVAYLNEETGPLALRRVIVGMGTDEYVAVVATRRWATGWRAPLGWTVEFDESFTDDPAWRAQAAERIPARGWGQRP